MLVLDIGRGAPDELPFTTPKKFRLHDSKLSHGDVAQLLGIEEYQDVPKDSPAMFIGSEGQRVGIRINAETFELNYWEHELREKALRFSDPV